MFNVQIDMVMFHSIFLQISVRCECRRILITTVFWIVSVRVLFVVLMLNLHPNGPNCMFCLFGISEESEKMIHKNNDDNVMNNIYISSRSRSFLHKKNKVIQCLCFTFSISWAHIKTCNQFFFTRYCWIIILKINSRTKTRIQGAKGSHQIIYVRICPVFEVLSGPSTGLT